MERRYSIQLDPEDKNVCPNANIFAEYIRIEIKAKSLSEAAKEAEEYVSRAFGMNYIAGGGYEISSPDTLELDEEGNYICKA